MKDFRISIFVKENRGWDRTDEPVRLGIPFARGLLSDPEGICLLDAQDQSIPVQGRILGLWPDKSIKWLLIDFFASVSPNQRTAFSLCPKSFATGPGRSEDAQRVRIDERGDGIEANTGHGEFKIARGTFLPFSAVRVDGVEFVSVEGSHISLVDEDGVEFTPIIDSLTIEEDGPLRSTVMAEGSFISPKSKSPILFKSRMSFFTGMSLVKMEFEIKNPQAAVHPGGLWDLGDPGSIFFRDLSLHFRFASDPAGTSMDYQILDDSVPKEDPNLFGSLCENRQQSDLLNLLIYQDSSGGENWNSTNHLDRTGTLSVQFRGYKVWGGRNGTERIIKEGFRASPLIVLKSNGGWLAATIQDFWQNFPKALRAEGEVMSISLFPRECHTGFEIQGGEKKRHLVFLDFGLPDQKSSIRNMQTPIHAWVAPQWVEETGAISYFVHQKSDENDDYEKYVRNIIKGPNSFFNKRELIDEYGWRNFGDTYADHEAVNHPGPDALVSHFNNQYDFIFGALVHYLKTGDERWHRLMCDAALHTIDIDIYHTDADKSAYNRGLFWHTDHYRDARTCTHRTYSRKNSSHKDYGGGPSNEHNYSSGLLHYYYLTGDREAFDAVQGLAEWVLAMDDGSRNPMALIDEGPTGGASQTVSSGFHKPGRGCGNSINTLMDAYRLTNDRRYFAKTEELIQRCIHPADDIAALDLDDPEYRWSYLVFLQILGKYLDFKAELDEKDYMFFYARESLLCYADWMAEHEVPYKEVLHKVLIPSETWPAHDIRKCHIFHVAAKYGSIQSRPVYRQKADFFLNAA